MSSKYIDVNMLKIFHQRASISTLMWTSNDYEGFVHEVSEYLTLTSGENEGRKFRGLAVKDDILHTKTISRMRGYLAALITQLDAQRQLAEQNRNVSSSAEKQVEKKLDNSKDSRFVFLVHGHDDEIKESVARFIEKLGLKVIILHEQPNNGKTIIEKFEEFAEKISYAIILLTPDDIGASRANPKDYKFRARQNVVYELGFFNAKLGRSRVCALRKGDVELPSDYFGVLYVPFDDEGAWKVKIAKEMKTIGLSVDLNNAL